MMMKTTSAVVMAAIMALAFTAGEASARQSHREHVREYQSHQYAPPPANEYESLSQGRQSNPNPDRQLYVPELPF
jgi:hypothetical protein